MALVCQDAAQHTQRSSPGRESGPGRARARSSSAGPRPGHRLYAATRRPRRRRAGPPWGRAPGITPAPSGGAAGPPPSDAPTHPSLPGPHRWRRPGRQSTGHGGRAADPARRLRPASHDRTGRRAEAVADLALSSTVATSSVRARWSQATARRSPPSRTRSGRRIRGSRARRSGEAPSGRPRRAPARPPPGPGRSENVIQSIRSACATYGDQGQGEPRLAHTSCTS